MFHNQASRIFKTFCNFLPFEIFFPLLGFSLLRYSLLVTLLLCLVTPVVWQNLPTEAFDGSVPFTKFSSVEFLLAAKPGGTQLISLDPKLQNGSRRFE